MATSREINQVGSDPLAFTLTLPDGCTPGRSEAAREFVEIIGVLRREYPNHTFDLLPFNYDTPKDGTNPALSAILAIAK